MKSLAAHPLSTLSLAALMLALPLSAPAQQVPDAMTAQEFDAYSQGKTFYYGAQGEPYGAEEYLPDRRVRWSFLDGNCQEGRWYEEAGHICFVYEDMPDPQCWSFVEGSSGLTAYFQGGSQTVLYEMQTSPEPMICHGPEVGV